MSIQSSLFPWLTEELGPLTVKQQALVTTLEQVRIEEFIYSTRGFPGRPAQDRTAIARAFIAKMVYQLPTTRALLDRLSTDSALRRICGWERKNDVLDTLGALVNGRFRAPLPSFLSSRLPERVHEALIKNSYAGELVGHISRDSTAIEAREKPAKKAAAGNCRFSGGGPNKAK